MRILYCVALLFTAPAVFAQTSACSDIEDAQARLECFDRQFPRQKSPSSAPEPAPLESGRVPAAAPPANAAAPDAAAEAEATPEAAPEPATAPEPVAASQPATSRQPAVAPDPPSRRGMLDWPGRSEQAFDATVLSVRKQDKTKMVFRLDNEQIWLQSSPRPLPIRKGDRVTISPGTVGGFILRTEHGTATRVSRIK